MRRKWIVAIYQSIAVVATAYATLVLHSGANLGWFWGYLAAINLVTFAFFGFDKAFVGVLARLRVRFPERVLVWGLAFPGGILGAWTAMRLFRHKTGTDKWRFRLALRQAFLLQLLAVVGFGILVGVGVASFATLEKVIEILVGLVHGVTSRVLGLLGDVPTQVFGS